MMNRASDRGFRWRLVDPYCRVTAAKRPPHMRLSSVLRQAAVRARYAGVRRSPYRLRFHPLTAETLDARRIGIAPRLLRGAR